MNIDQYSLETEFLIAICRPTGDKWQSKSLFLSFFAPRSSIFKSVIECRLSGVFFLEIKFCKCALFYLMRIHIKHVKKSFLYHLCVHEHCVDHILVLYTFIALIIYSNM